MTLLHDEAPRTASLAEFARLLIGHLDAESALLRESKQTLQSMNEALRGADSERLQSAQLAQEKLAGRLERARRERGELLRSIGDTLGLELPSLSVRSIAARLPASLADRLDEARTRTERLLHEIHSLNRQNAILAMHCLSFVRDCLDDLYGEAAAVARYSAAGRTVEVLRGPILERRG